MKQDIAVLQFSCDTSHPMLAQTLQVKGSVPSKTALTSDISHKFRGPQATHTSNQLATIPGSAHDPIMFNHSLEQLTELRKTPYLWLCFIIKDTNLGAAKWNTYSKVWEGLKWGLSVSSPCGIRMPNHLPGKSTCSPARRLHCALVCRDFIKVSLRSTVDLIIGCVTELTP